MGSTMGAPTGADHRSLTEQVEAGHMKTARGPWVNPLHLWLRSLRISCVCSVTHRLSVFGGDHRSTHLSLRTRDHWSTWDLDLEIVTSSRPLLSSSVGTVGRPTCGDHRSTRFFPLEPGEDHRSTHRDLSARRAGVGGRVFQEGKTRTGALALSQNCTGARGEFQRICVCVFI